MSSIAIMQPTYIPWAGYFNLISKVDYFVFLDDVKIEKQSWQVRNKIISDHQERYISLPVRGSRNQMIKEVQLNDSIPWRKKHTKLLEHTYAKHPLGKTCLLKVLPTINSNKITSLATLNIEIIKTISKELGFNPIFHLSSQLNTVGERSKRLLSLCKELSCDHYFSPAGSKAYIEKDGYFSNSNISIEFQNFTPPVYRQLNQPKFVPYLSIIDMVANIGWRETAGHIS